MEVVRRAVRSIFKYDSSVYRFGAAALDFLATIRTDGYVTWKILNRLKNGAGGDRSPRPVVLRNLMHPLFLRPCTDDAGTVVTNVIRAEYGQLSPLTAPVWMVDAGAYIGDTSAYFLSRFPGLTVIALEPDPTSHGMAQLNLKPYGDRVILLQQGLSATGGISCLSGEGTGAALSDEGIGIDCTTIPMLLDRFHLPRIDILKMDIEGAEEAIFSTNPEAWLSRIGTLVIEIQGEKVRELISRVLSANGFTMQRYRSVWYCRPVQG